MMRQRLALWAVLVIFAGGVTAITFVGRADNDGGGGGGNDLPLLGVPGSNSAANAMMAERDALMAPGSVEYRVEGELVDPGGEAPAYSLGRTTDIDAVARLAAALGLDGKVVTTADEWSVVVGLRGLHVARQPGLPWWYSTEDYSNCKSDSTVSSDGSLRGPESVVCGGGVSPGGVSPGSGGVIEPDPAPDDARPQPVPCEMPPCPEGQACIQKCPEPEPFLVEEPPMPPRPTDLPSKIEAERLGRRFLEKVGVDLTEATVRVDDGFDRWYVAVERAIDGLRVLGFDASVSVGRKGEIQNANGHLATPELLGRYPLAGLEAGLARLRAGTALGENRLTKGEATTLIAPVPRGAPVVDCPPDADCMPPGGVSPECPPDTMCEPSETPKPWVRTITGVSLGLLFTGENLVPAYLFALEELNEVDEGGREPVIAVVDRYLEPLTPSFDGGPEPMMVDPAAS